MTHAFFKALLFLGSGAVILALHHEQDLFKMGASSARCRPSIARCSSGAAALAGFPLLSGFFSKDEIFAGIITGRAVFGNPVLNTILYIVAAATALLTAFYTFRLVFLAFEGSRARTSTPTRAPA